MIGTTKSIGFCYDPASMNLPCRTIDSLSRYLPFSFFASYPKLANDVCNLICWTYLSLT